MLIVFVDCNILDYQIQLKIHTLSTPSKYQTATLRKPTLTGHEKNIIFFNKFFEVPKNREAVHPASQQIVRIKDKILHSKYQNKINSHL